jgi:catechol 2,3-dioxygenase-like lactoylglutathione lyase family enzyme
MERRSACSADETASELVYTDSREVVMSDSAGATVVERKSVVSPLLLSHGTLMSKNLAASRRFYEEFLGLEVVRHARPAMMLRLRSGMYVVCVCIGEKVPNQHVLTHWGLNVASREEVDRAHADAHRLKETYGIQKIQNVRERHGAYGFYLQDLDNNWWEIQCERRTIDAFFAGGDVIDMGVHATDSAESHE